MKGKLGQGMSHIRVVSAGSACFALRRVIDLPACDSFLCSAARRRRLRRHELHIFGYIGPQLHATGKHKAYHACKKADHAFCSED